MSASPSGAATAPPDGLPRAVRRWLPRPRLVCPPAHRTAPVVELCLPIGRFASRQSPTGRRADKRVALSLRCLRAAIDAHGVFDEHPRDSLRDRSNGTRSAFLKRRANGSQRFSVWGAPLAALGESVLCAHRDRSPPIDIGRQGHPTNRGGRRQRCVCWPCAALAHAVS
jgi:hypothetical protein